MWRPIRRMVSAAIITSGPLLMSALGAMAEELPVPPIPPDHFLLGDSAPFQIPMPARPLRRCRIRPPLT